MAITISEQRAISKAMSLDLAPPSWSGASSFPNT